MFVKLEAVLVFMNFKHIVTLFLCLTLFSCISAKAKDDFQVQKSLPTHTAESKGSDMELQSKKKSSAHGFTGERLARERQGENKRDEKRIDLKYSVLGQASNTVVRSAIIRSAQELEQYAKSIHCIQFPKNLDFDKQAIVIASAGTFNTGAYSIVLDSAVLEKNILNLNFAVLSPSASSIVTQAFTYPYIAVLLDIEKNVDIKICISGSNSKDWAF